MNLFFLLQIHLVSASLNFIRQEKAGAKLRQGQTQNKEVIQEYIAGADSIAEDPATRDYVVMRARMMAAK